MNYYENFYRYPKASVLVVGSILFFRLSKKIIFKVDGENSNNKKLFKSIIEQDLINLISHV